MGTRNKYQSRENRAEVREILLREWDPIGVRDMPEAQDEYDGYVAEIYVMLMDQRAASEMAAAYLLEVATVRMGLSDDPELETACERTAEMLVALRPAFETH
jgi:hypothetical protein